MGGDVDLSAPGGTTGSDPVLLPRDDVSRSNDTARCDSHVLIKSETVKEKDVRNGESRQDPSPDTARPVHMEAPCP